MSRTVSNKTPEPATTPPRSHKTKWIVGLLLLLFAAAAAMNLPHGYSDDLSHIGKGRATIVLIRNKNAVNSFDLIQVLDSVRDKYDGKVEFLLTDFDTPEGRAFMAAKNIPPITLALFDAGGSMVKVLHPPQTTESIQQEIAGAFGVKP